jgi:hypothetical protein
MHRTRKMSISAARKSNMAEYNRTRETVVELLVLSPFTARSKADFAFGHDG